MRGFTLVELLVVVLIIGLGISIIGINVGGNSNYKLQVEAKQFANSTALMAEEAALANQEWGVDLYRETLDGEELFGYRWLVRSNDGYWELPSAEDFAKEILFSPGVILRLRLDGLDTEQEIEFKQKADTQVPLWETPTTTLTETKKPDITPDIWLFSSGEMSVFAITLFDQENPDAMIEITGDELGRVTLDTGEDDEE